MKTAEMRLRNDEGDFGVRVELEGATVDQVIDQLVVPLLMSA